MSLPVALALYGPTVTLVAGIVGVAVIVGLWVWTSQREARGRRAIKRRLDL